MTVGSRVRSGSPDCLSGSVINLLDYLSSTHHAGKIVNDGFRKTEAPTFAGNRSLNEHHVPFLWKSFEIQCRCTEWRRVLPRSLLIVSSEIPSSKYTSLLISPGVPVELLWVSGLPADMQKRGASRAAWGVNPRNMFNSTWMCPCGWYTIKKPEQNPSNFATYLHKPTHDTITKEKFVISCHHTRYDGVVYSSKVRYVSELNM